MPESCINDSFVIFYENVCVDVRKMLGGFHAKTQRHAKCAKDIHATVQRRKILYFFVLLETLREKYSRKRRNGAKSRSNKLLEIKLSIHKNETLPLKTECKAPFRGFGGFILPYAL
jgi:hypothetical protein